MFLIVGLLMIRGRRERKKRMVESENYIKIHCIWIGEKAHGSALKAVEQYRVGGKGREE
jgi:hypothetical protein